MKAGDSGAVSTFLAVIALALLAATGLVIDGGRKLSTLREAAHLADNAARAGAQAVDIDTLRSTGTLRLQAPEATRRADAYLTRTGHTGTVAVTDDTVTVTVSITVVPRLLPVGPITVTATETAAAVTEDPRP